MFGTPGKGRSIAVVPSDAGDEGTPTGVGGLTYPRQRFLEFDSLYVGGVGDVVIHQRDGTNVKFSAVPVGTTLHVTGTRVMATGTTATLMVANYKR